MYNTAARSLVRPHQHFFSPLKIVGRELPRCCWVYPLADYADSAENTHHNQLIASNINRGAVADSEYLHNLRRMSYSKLYYHIVFVVKKRLILSGLQPLCG